MAHKRAIPEDVRAQVEARVEAFNHEVIKYPGSFFSVRFRGKYVYLDRYYFGSASQRARLTYTGDIEDWDFAIYRHSDGRYDPNEWMFPGGHHLDGTIEGALRAAMEAYP